MILINLSSIFVAGHVASPSSFKNAVKRGGTSSAFLRHEVPSTSSSQYHAFEESEHSEVKASQAKKRKLMDNQISPSRRNKMDECYDKSRTSGNQGEATTMVDVSSSLKMINHNVKRVRENVCIIKNVLLENKRTDEVWDNIRKTFPFELPLSTVEDVESCDNFIQTADNKEKLVS